MSKIVIVEKGGDCKDTSLKNKTLEGICKKCGFRKLVDFDIRHKWKINYQSITMYLVLYSKNSGRANTENKFDFPPPIDNELYFGNIAIVAYKNSVTPENVVDFTVNDWCKIYEKLMGGFIDLTKESTEEESEEDIPEEELTKQGYHKDGFIVDSEEEEVGRDIKESPEESEEESEEEQEEELNELYKEDGSEESSGESESELEEGEGEGEEGEIIGSELSEEEYITESETEYE